MGNEIPAARPADRRAAIALAASANDIEALRKGLDDENPTVRAGALRALVRVGAHRVEDIALAASDESPAVRRALCELASTIGAGPFAKLLDDVDPSVVEAASFAVAEVDDHSALPRLIEIATGHADPICRESAVAALGALGDPDGKSAVIAALNDTNYVRRRAVVALAAFEGDDVDAALAGRLADRDWQVRQAAEDVIGVNRPNGA